MRNRSAAISNSVASSAAIATSPVYRNSSKAENVLYVISSTSTIVSPETINIRNHARVSTINCSSRRSRVCENESPECAKAELMHASSSVGIGGLPHWMRHHSREDNAGGRGLQDDPVGMIRLALDFEHNVRQRLVVQERREILRRRHKDGSGRDRQENRVLRNT